MMQEVSSDDTNGESTFEFVDRRLEDLQLGNGNSSVLTPVSTPLPPVAKPTTERSGLTDMSSSTSSLIAAPAPLPSTFFQSPAPAIPTYAISSLPPPPAALPSFLNVSEPSLTAFPPSNPILAQSYTSGASQAPPMFHPPDTVSYSAVTTVPTAMTSLELPFSEYQSASSVSQPLSTHQHPEGSGGGVWGWIKGTVSGNEFLSKVAEKAKSSVDSVITTLDPQMSEYIYSGGDIQLVVASDKEIKVEAIREAFQTVLGRATVVSGVAAQSSVAAQPVGFSAGLKGAEDRIAALRQSGLVEERHPIVAIENALVEVIPDRWFDVGCLVLDDPVLGQALHAHTQLIPVPLQYIHQLQNDTPTDYPLRWSGFSMTVGQTIGLALQVPHTDWHQHVAGVSRRELIFSAAKVLAWNYKLRRESMGAYRQPAWSMG